MFSYTILGFHKSRESSYMQYALSDNSFTYCILIFRVDDFSERTITSSLTSEENEGDFEDRVSTADEVIWSSTSESKYQVSHFSESHMISSNGTSSSLSLFRSEVKEFSPSRGGYPENEHETVQFSSKKLFSIMKTNKNKNLVFSSDFNFSRSSRITTESEDLNVAPCPPAHLFLSRDQVRLLEENVRNQIALKSKTTLESKTTYLYSRLQESLIQNQYSIRMGISTQPQDSFPGQNAPQNQHFYEARYTSQAQQFVNNQESVNSQPDIMARYFALPQDLVRKPFSSSMQDSSQTQDMDRSQHLVNVSYSVETQDSVKGLESDKHFEQAQYSVWLKDSNKIKYLIRGRNAIFKNARFLILMLSPNSFAEGVLQIKSVKPGGQKQIASSELSQYSVYGSGPLSPILKRQKNRRKTLHSKSKLSLKVPSQKSKKTPTLRVFQMTVCHTSKPSKFGYKYNAKKEELHQRKGISEMALHLTYVSKLIPPYVKKYARKKLVKVTPGVTGCRHSLSPDAENVSYVGSIEKRGTSGSTKNKKQHGRENKGQITISPKIPPQLEQSFMINTFQLKSPCSSLIEMTWKNKESLKDPITQAKEIGIAEFCAPNSKKTSDLHIPKQESPLKEALSEPWQKFVSSPEVESNRRLKTQEDLKSTENSHLPLSSGEKLPASSPEMQKCFPDGNTQKQKDFLEIVLETSEVNLLISLGIKEHEGSEQLASVKTQDQTEDVIMKEKKPLLTLHVTECDNLSGSEGLECNTRSNIKNMQGKRIFATFHNATNTTISEPPDREMHSGLKGKTDTSTTGVSHSVVKLEKLPDEKKTWDVKYIEKRCIFKKSQEHDREEEQTFQEAVPELTKDFSLSLQLKQKPKYVRFEIKQSSSGSRKTQSKEQEVQPQTLPIETILGTSPCPPMDPFQIEVKQSRDRPTGRGTADPESPLPVLENPRVGEVLIETTECGVPFGGSPRKIPDDHITEEKADLQQVLPATALGSFIIYMLPLSHFKRQQIRKKLSGAKRALSPKSVIMKVKKPTNLLMPHIRRHGTASLRKRLRGNFKILIKEMLQDKIVADVLVNVTYPHMSILPRIRTHGRLNAENRGQTKLKQEKSEDEREEKYSDSINKGSDSGNTLEEVKLQDEVRGDKEAPPEAVLHDSWNLQLDANPEKELKAEEDIPQPITSMETLTESVYSPIMDLFHVETMKKSLTTQADLKCTADSETPLPTSEKSLAGDPPNQTRESDVLDYGSDAREMGYFSAETSSAELPKDLPATFPETFNCHMPILTHSKMNKNKVRFSSTEGSVKPRSVHTKTMKPSVSQVFNSTGQRKKLDSKYKAKLEKINQANGLVYEFINALYSPMQSFCHAQLKQGELGEVRPWYVDFFDKSRAFHDREEKVEDGEEVEQKTLLEAASQHTQYLWPDACQGKKAHLDEPDSALDCLTQELSVNEQDAQHQAWFVQTALQTGHQKGPREAEELKKTSETENDVTAPMGPKIPSPKAQNSSSDTHLNTMTECGLPYGGNSEKVLDSYFVENNSELPKDLQVTCLNSFDSVEPFVSKSERKKNTLDLGRKHITASHRYRTISGEKPSASHMLNGTQSKGLQCNFKTKMKNPQQNKNRVDAFLNVIQSNLPILPNTKMSSGLNVETGMQRIARLGHMQPAQEKLLNGRKVCCPDYMVSTLTNSVRDEKEEEGKHETLPAPENSRVFIFNAYQENCDLVKSDEELKQPRSINIQVQPRIHGTQAILGSASCPMLDQFQFGKLESYARFSPPKSGEARMDEIIFSTREYGVPSDANHQKEQAGGIEKKDTVTFDFCIPALSTFKRKKHLKKYSDTKTLVNLKCGILKAKKPSVSYILSIKGGASPNHRKELGYNSTTKLEKMDQGEKMAAKMYSLMSITPDINRYSKKEREKGMLGERSLSSKQVKQALLPHQENITSDDTKENSLQDAEEERSEQETLKVIPQHSQHFKFCSGQREELDLHQSENQGRGNILFVTEQDISQQMQRTDSMRGEKPKKSYQTQNGAIYTASSKLPLLKSKKSLIGQVLMDTMKGGVLSVGSHMGELYSHDKEENAEFKKDLQATVLESSDVSTPDLSESKRQRKTFTSRALKNKMSPKCVIMKARKTPTSPTFKISGNGYLKNLHPKTLKSQIIDLLIHIKCSGVLEDLIAERKEGLAQELPATILESLDLSTLALPALKRKRNNLKYIDKRNKMSLEWVTSKAKKAAISQTLTITKHGTPSQRQFKCNFKIMMKPGKPTADMTLNAISSPVPALLDMKMRNRIKAESDVSWKMRFSHELQQQEQSPDGERACCADSSDRRGPASKDMKEVKDQREEGAPRNSRHSSFIAGKMKEPHFVKSELELKNSAKKKSPEPLNTAPELQQQTLFTRSELQCVSCSILNSLALEKQPKRTKTQKALKYAKSPKILSPMLEKSIPESLFVTTQSDIPSERGPRKELARSTPEGKTRLQKDLQVRSLKCFDFSTPALSEFEGWRNSAQISKSRNGKTQMASILKTINITKSDALSHGKEQDFILENMAKEISQSMSGIFVNTFPSPIPVSPAIKTHKKVNAKRDPLRNKSNIIQPEQHEGERLCPYSSNKWSNSSSTLESRLQNEKEREGNRVLFEAGLQFLYNIGRRKDQNMLITEQDVQRQTLVSENKLESTCSPLIPFQTEELSKNIPSQKDMPHGIGQKIPCPKSGKAVFDYFSTDETECSTISDGSPARKLDVHIAVSLQPEEEEEDIKTQKVMKHRVDQNILPTKSGNSVLVDPGDKRSRRKMGAKKSRVLQRDLLTMSTISVSFDSESQEKILKFSGRKNLRGPNCVTMKSKKKALYSQMLNITQHDNLYCRKEQDYNLKSTINDMQQNKSIANALLSPTPVSTDNKIDIEMHSTSEAEMDQPRVKLYSRTSAELGKSPCDGEVWKANSTDPQNRSSNTMKMNVQHEREEENIKKMLLESVPHYNQHFSFSARHMKNFGSYQSESELSDLEVRSTWNLSCAAQKMRQEKCFRETILEPVSRHVMNFLQVETEKKSLHTQERIKCMGGLKTPFPKARKSETSSIQGGVLWGGNPRRKWDSYIFEKKAWNQNDLVRIVLKSSGYTKSQSYTLEFVGKKSIINPKHVTLKAKKRSVSQLLNITGCITGSHRKMKGCKFQYKMKTRQWFEGVGEASLLAAEGTKIPPPKLVTDERSLDATARGTLYNRTLHRNLHGHITEEKAELWENSATTFLEPVDLFTPILPDSESQINTVRLLEEKITLNPRCLTLKEKEPAISQILKIRGRFTTKHRKKLGSNLKTKMQQMSQGKNVADTFPNTIYFTPDTYDIERQSRFKIGMDRVSRFSHVQPTQMQLPVEGLVISQPFNITGHAALSINEQQGKKIDRKREKTVLNVDLKFVYDSMPILSHLKMEPSPSTWDIYEESSGKRNALNKANASSAYAYIPMYPKIIKHKAKAKTAGVKNTMHIRRMKLKAKKPPVSQLFNTIGCGTRRNKKELRCDIKKQKEFQQDKTIADLFLNTVCDSGSLSSQIKQFTVEREKSRPRKPINVPPQLELEKSLNKRKMSSSESTDIKSAILRNIRTLKQCIREQKEKRQIVLLDILPQCRDQLVISQHVKKELDHVKIGVALKREVYPGLASQKREINYTRFNIPRIRTHTECEFLVPPRVKHKDADVIKHSVSIPWGRGVSKKTNISLNSKGQNIFLTELDASQQKTHKEQEFQKQGSISLTIRGSFAYPIMEPPHLKNTGKVAEEDIYTNKRNISHLLRREDIKETDISQGSKGQKFLCTNLVGQQTMSAAQKGEVKPAGVPESIVDSVSCPNKEPLQVTQAVNTKKEDVSTSLSLHVNPGRKERSKLTDIPLRLNGQKMTSEKLGVKQLHSSNQNKENILESISSCMLGQLYNEKLKKKVSAKGVSSKVLSSVVDKALNEADTPVDQPSLSLQNRRRQEHQKESTCKVLPKSVSHSSMDVLQIKLPCVKKTLKAPMYHTANTEGIGLLVEGKEEEHPECIHYISPKSASHSLRDVLQSKIPCEKKASEEVVSTVDYIPSTEKISSLVTGKESKVHTGKGQSGMKLTSLCTSLPSLSHTNVNSRIKVGQDKSGIPRSCLPPLKLQVSPNVRKTSFAESINRGSLSNVRESKHLPQGKKEDGVYVKDIRGLKCVTFKGKKTPFEHTLHGKEPQWNNKEQEEMMQKDKSNLDIVQSKRHASIPSSPHVEWDPGIKEVLMRGITGFCLPSLTLQELSDTMGICEEPADDILSSIKKAKYMPQKDGVEMALEEIRHPKRIALKAKRTPIAHELQLNIKEKEKKMQEDKDKPVGIRSKSCVSISFPPYSEVDTRIKGEEALLIKTRPSFLQTELQESSDRGKIAYKQSIHDDTSNSVKESKEHYIMQEEEEKVKMVKVILLRKKRSPILQEIQLDIKEQEEKTQKIKGEPNVLVTNTSTCIPAPSHLQLDTRIKKADYVTEVTRFSLPELSQQKSSDAVKKANKSTDGDITSDVQEAKEHTPQKEETNVEKSAKRDMMHPKDKDLKRKKALLQDIPLNLKEQVKEDPEGEEQGKVDRGGKGEQEVVLPTNWASESLTHHELNTRIGEEDRQEITGSAVSQLQLQKSSDAGKIVYTKSAGDDISNDVRVVQEYEPQEGEDRRKIVNIKYIMYPKGTTSKAKVLPLPHVLCISGGCDVQIREVQTSIKEKLRYIQERSELGKVLTRPFLPQFKLNKSIEGKEEKQVSRPFLLPSWPRESSNAEKLKRTVLPLNDISNDSKRTKYMTQREEDKANTFEKDIMHSMYIALRAKKLPLSLILKTKKLQVNIKEQVKVGQEDDKETVVLLRKIHPFLISSTHLKWNTIKDKEGEPGIIRNDAPHLELQESLPSGQIASTDSPDSHVKKGDPRPRQAERNGVQTGAMNGSVQPQGTDFKAKTSPPSHTFSVTEHGALNQRKEPQWHMKEKVEQGQQRTGDPDVALTKTSPSTPSPSYHRLDTRTKVDKDLLAVTGFSPSQLLCSKSSGAGKIRYADSNESIRSCNVIIKAYQSMPYTEVKDRVKIKGGKDRRFPQIITSTAETSPLPYLPSRKRLPLNIKEQGKEVPEGKSEPEMVLKETYAALPSPSYLKWDTKMNEKEDTLRITQSYFPPPKIQDPSSSGKKPYTKSFDGCVLKEKDRLKTDLENKMVPIPMALKAKKLPLSRILDTKKLQWKIKEQEGKVQTDENDLATHLENICTPLLTLPYLKFGSGGEGYMKRITDLPLLHLQSEESPDAVKTTYAETTDGELSNDVKKLKEHTLLKEVRDREKKVDMNSMVDPNDRYLKAKKSPNLLRYNLSALRWKTKKQEGTAQEGQREPGGAVLTKTWTCRSPLLHFDTNTRVEEKRIPILTRSSFPTVSSQESSDSEDMECIEPITSDILISPQKGKYHMPQNKEKAGVEIVNLMFPKHQEKKMQESEDEPSVVVATSSSPLPSFPHLQLDKETQVGDEMLGPARSVVQRESNAGEVVHTEAIHGDVIKDSQNKKQLVPQEEEQDRKKTIDMRNMTHTTDISLKSRKSPPLLMLHRTELHLNIGGQEQKKHECPGKPPGTVLRKIYVSKPPAELTLDKGIQVDEERLRIKRFSLIPQMLSAVSDTKMRADTGAICDIRERKQHMSQKEKKHEVKTVDMRIRMHHKEARISSISHIFNTKEFVLNIKELKENVYKGKDELPVLLTRTFFSVPSAPSLYLDSGSKVDKDVPGLTGSSPPQQNLQESSDTQKTAIREVVAGDGEIVKKVGHSVHQEEAVQQWTSNFMISVQRRNEPPRVKSEGDLSQLVLNSQHENIYLTGFGTISGKRLEYFFTGQEVQPEKYKTETFTTFLSYPTMEPTKIGNLKKQTEIMDNLNHKISPKVLVTPPRKISKEIYITFGAPVSAKGFSVSEQDAHQQKTLSKASPGSADSYKFDKPENDVHNNDKVSKMLSPKVMAPQTEGSLEKMNIAESDTSPIIEEQEIVVKKQVVLQSESGHKTWLDSSFSLKFPLQNGRQKTPLETDVHKQTIVYPRIQILPGIHMDITVFDTIGGKKEQGLPVPQQEEYILESLQKSLSSHWTFPLQSGDLERKNKMDTSTTINLEQKTLEMEEGELKIDTNIAIRLAADKTEMHKHTMVNLEENKKRDTSNTVNLNIPSLKAQIPQINTQLITHRANSCPIKQKHKKELEVSGAKQNIQPQKLFQKHVLDSFYAYIPLSLKFKGWKGRLTVADLKRELSPKYLTMKIPNHPVSQILNNMGRGTPSNRKKLEYDLKKPKKTVLRSEDASGIFVRSLSISTVSSSQIEEIVDSETNRGREKILCPSEFQQKSPHTRGNSLSTVKERDQNFTDRAPQDSQPSVVEEQQMQKLPSVKSEANLGSETKEKNSIPQTKEERVVPGHDSSRIIKESDLRMTEEEEKAPKPLLTPAEGPLMSDEPKDNVEAPMESTLSMSISPPGLEEPQHGTQLFNTMECISPPRWGDQSEPIQATTTQNVQQQKPFPGTGPIPSQVKSNETKVVADSTSAESLLPLFEAIKNIFESQIKNMIYDNICEDILKKVKAPKPDDWKLPPRAGSPDTTCTTVPPEVQPKPILERFTPKENNKLTNHFESKAFEIKLNLIPEMAKQSFQKFNFYLNQSFSEDNSWRLYPRHKKKCFLSLEGIDTVELHLKQKCAQDSPPVSCMKTLIVSVSSDSEEITTKLRSISKLESGVSSVTSAKQMPWPHILQNYSVEEKDKLLIHFSMKTLEIHMKAFPRIVRESYAVGSPQNIRKPLSKCIHSGFKVPKRKNRILLLFEEESLHQIDLDLQYKYLHFLLGLPVGSVFPKPTALPKHILKLNTVAICENIDNRGESGGGLCIDMELLEQHISFKNQSPHENSSLRKFREPTLVCASDPNQQGPVQKDTTALSELKSHTTLEKDKQCHVWFQETDICKSFDSKTQESTPSLVDSHSTQISEDFTESQTNIESSANLEECSALEAHESEECMFLEANPYLSQESQNILFELQKGIPLENLYKMKKSKTNLKPLYREDSGSQRIRGCRKHSSIVTPSYESHKSRKYRSSSKMPSPDWLCHDSLNAVEVLSRSSSIPFSEEKSSWTARCRTNHSLAPLTESNIKLHLAKGQGKPHRHLESKEGKKAKSDLFRKNNIHWDCDYSYTCTKEKCTRKKKVRNCESQRSNYFSSKPKLPSKLHQEDINFHSERKQNQPFFYACIPADSLEIMPQTIRWTIPPRTLRKTNFRVPLVAKISSSFNIWTSSKKFLESLLESFSPVHPNRY
ncbi:coiled-coil domain-containing protein 168 [Phoca vitulina]|uniref:coiled-coil domain-containing protein 168 n=1 Tax=Phoca vitulina TaxID=9720 RepID=UPI001395D476|nr:coiled-coil domain-containing protein 168 [Phoca vitulina]